MKVVIQNLAIKGYHDIHVIPNKDLEMLILPTPILSLTRIVLQCWHIKLDLVSCFPENPFEAFIFDLGIYDLT